MYYKACTSTTLLYCKNCTKYFPVLLCTTRLAQSNSQYYLVLQSSQKAFPILLCTTKLAQSTSQYYFVLQDLHKALPGTTLYYKACTKYFPVLLCTTRLAQSTSQYYFVLQNLHRALPSTTHSCARYFRTHIKPLHTASFCTQQGFGQRRFYTHSKLLRTESFTQRKLLITLRSFYTRLACTHGTPRSFYTKKGLHRSTFLRRKAFTHSLQQAFTHGKLLHREAFTQRNLYTEKLVHTEKLLHTEAFKCIQKALRTASIFTQKPSLCNIHTLRFAAPRHKPVCIYAHGNKTWQQSRSHSIAICNYRFQNTLQLRTHEQPHVAEHPGGTKKRQNERTRNGLTHELPFIAGCNHFTRKNNVSRSGFLPKTKPMQHSCSHYNAFFAARRHKPACIYAHSHTTSPSHRFTYVMY